MSAIHTCIQHDMSREDIGHMCGYADRQMVDRVINPKCDTLMDGSPELILIRRASELGNDDPANTYSAPHKYAVDMKGVEVNNDVADDVQRIMEGSGYASAAYRNTDLAAMSVYITKAQRGLQGLILEREALREKRYERIC